MPEISTLFFIYGIENIWEEEYHKLETEFSEELKLLDKLKTNPDEAVIKRLIQKSKEVCH